MFEKFKPKNKIKSYTKQDFLDSGYAPINFYHYDILRTQIKDLCAILREDILNIYNIEDIFYNFMGAHQEIISLDETGEFKKILENRDTKKELEDLKYKYLIAIEKAIELYNQHRLDITHINNVKNSIVDKSFTIDDFDKFGDLTCEILHSGIPDFRCIIGEELYWELREVLGEFFTTNSFKSLHIDELGEFTYLLNDKNEDEIINAETPIDFYINVLKYNRNEGLSRELVQFTWSFCRSKRKRNNFTIPFYFMEFILNKNKINDSSMFNHCYKINENGLIDYNFEQNDIYRISGAIENRPISKLEVITKGKMFSIFKFEDGSHILLNINPDNDSYNIEDYIEHISKKEVMININDRDYNILNDSELKLMELINYGDIKIIPKDNDFNYQKASYADYLRGTFDRNFILGYRNQNNLLPTVPLSRTQIKNKNKKEN